MADFGAGVSLTEALQLDIGCGVKMAQLTCVDPWLYGPVDSFGQKSLPDLDLCSFPEFLPTSKINARDGTFHFFAWGSGPGGSLSH